MQANESRGLVLLGRRLVNILGKPFGINLFPRAFPPVSSASQPIDVVFDDIYSTNKWGSAESLSGVGSELGRAARYRERLRECLLDNDLRSIFDAPCGDLNWILPITTDPRFAYRGGDIAETLITNVKERYPQVPLEQFDICRSPFPEADVWHCRDCLFHLPFADVRRALENFAQSSIPYALLTTHAVAYMRNLDVSAGGFRYLDLERPPFALPRALAYLRDFRIGLDFPRYVGLWSRDQIAASLHHGSQS